jgi:hypothetical protein
MRKRNLDPEIVEAKAHEVRRRPTGKKEVEGAATSSFADLRTNEEIERKSDVFLANVRFIIGLRGMKQATVAKEARIPAEWLRQLTRRGLKQKRGGSEEYLERLRRFFLLDSVDELWSPTLIPSLKQTERRAAQIHPFLRSKDWPYAKRIVELLQSGDYDFLRDLIDRLSEREAAIAGQSYQEGQGEEDRASPEDMEKRLMKNRGSRRS